MPDDPITQSPSHLITQLPSLADLLEYHEETSNAEGARRIGGEVWERADALVIFSRPELASGLNYAGRVRSNPSDIERLVDEVSEWFIRRGVAPHFRVSPLTQPTNLAAILERGGFKRTEAETQMVLAVEDIDPAPAVERVRIELVRPEEIKDWAAIQSRGFGEDSPSPVVLEMAHAMDGTPGIRPYLGRLDGIPVAAGTLTEWAGVFGIYGVATLPQARRQGVATAMVRAMIRDAQAQGSLPICLQAETGSETQRWYERLGFRVVYDRTGWTREK